MRRGVWLAMVAVALVAGFLGGVAVLRVPVTVAAVTSDPTTLTVYERGQLAVGCYQAIGHMVNGDGDVYLIARGTTLKECLERVDKLP